MNKEEINFKGVAGGAILIVKGSDQEKIKKQIDKKIKGKEDFYQDLKILDVEGEDINLDQILDLKYLLKYHYNLQVDIESLDQEVEKMIRASKEDEQAQAEEELAQAQTQVKTIIEERGCQTIFQHGTLRSGMELVSTDHIVVVGDVNPGSILKARGNIIVMGNLKGVAYAGLDGNQDAIIAAYNLEPTQLALAGKIVRPPDNYQSESKLPEIARIHQGEVVIETYLPKREGGK